MANDRSIDLAPFWANGLACLPVANADLFAVACELNYQHGLPLTTEERNDAIVRLHKDGLTQTTIGERFRIKQAMVSLIVGAKVRSERILTVSHTELSPKHELVIRSAPKQFQDKIAGRLMDISKIALIAKFD